MSSPADELLDRLLTRCTFPGAASVTVAFSGGPDSTALLALAQRAGLDVTAHHVDHGLRPDSADDAERARSIAAALGARFELSHVHVADGPNVEARARAARRAVLPAGAMTGHTADDQAETVLLRLLRGSGGTGLGAMRPGPTHPILGLRRSETDEACRVLDIRPVRDPSNDRADVWRNRVRNEVLPLLADIAERDPVTILVRSADLLREESDLLDQLAADIDPTDARAVVDAPVVLARRALRGWLSEDGYPPDRASLDRVLAVARGDAVACELTGGRRVARTNQQLRIEQPQEDTGGTATAIERRPG